MADAALGLLLDLIGRFYDAALDPAAWPAALERLSDVFGGVPAHFGVQRLPEGMPWTVSVRRDPALHRAFQELFAPPAEPGRRRGPRRARRRPVPAAPGHGRRDLPRVRDVRRDRPAAGPGRLRLGDPRPDGRLPRAVLDLPEEGVRAVRQG